MKLFCALVGAKGNAFSVGIGEGQSVGELKDAIKAENPIDLNDVDADKLQLFLAKIGKDQWLPDEHDAAQGLEEGIVHEDILTLINGEKIKPTTTVQYWISEKNKMPPPPTTDHIHVLVTVPGQSASDRITSQAGVFDHCSDPFFSQFATANQVENWLEFSSMLKLTRCQKINVRSSYKVITDQVLLNLDANMVKYDVVMGTSGIGKSVFVYYAMWRLVKDKKRVLFFSKKGPLYFDGSTMFQCRVLPNQFDYQFWSPELWCLVDSVDPTRMKELPIEECSVLLASTSRQDCISEFMKQVPIPEVFYLPLWTQEELSLVAPLYPNDQDQWKNRFERLGGVPRLVFEDKRNP